MLSMQIDMDDLRKGIRALGNQLPAEVADILDHMSRKYLKAWRERRLGGPPGVKARPSRGGGIFVRFQKRKLRRGGGDHTTVGIAIGTDSKVAILQEEGGDVAGSGKGLTVPLFFQTKMFLPNPITGALRKTFADPNQIRGVFSIKNKAGQVLLMRRKNKKRSEPLFIVKKSVKLKPRLHFIGTFQEMETELYGIAAKRIPAAAAKAWRSAGG